MQPDPASDTSMSIQVNDVGVVVPTKRFWIAQPLKSNHPTHQVTIAFYHTLTPENQPIRTMPSNDVMLNPPTMSYRVDISEYGLR